MNQTGFSSSGPRCFGTSRRTSFVDVRDDDIPGPGTHNSSRIDRSTPTKWKFGTSTQRDTFLQKHPRPNPSPFQYSPNKNPTLNTSPLITFPKSQVQNPAEYKQDQNFRTDYNPDANANKYQDPSYSFGYTQIRDYSTSVPAPNNYQVNHNFKDKQIFNKTQNQFTKSSRPLPYGQQKFYPGVGQYKLNEKDKMNNTAYSFSVSQKLPDNKFQGATKYYNIGKQIKQPGKGFTMRPFYEQVKNKDIQQFPGPNHYNPKYLESKRKIINLTGKRSELYEKDLVKYPSPQKHVTSSQFYKTKKSLSFTKQLRNFQNSLQGPGPAVYNVETKLSDNQGYMGRKLKKQEQFVTPAGSNYNPTDHLTRATAQRVINYATNRSDFSKSITGQVGPGNYEGGRQSQSPLGKMSRSLKFEKSKNKNPGPGYYQIPNAIGSLPKYYYGQKKMSLDGYSTFALQLAEKTRKRQQWLKIKQIQKQKKQQQLRKQAEQQQEQKTQKQNNI